MGLVNRFFHQDWKRFAAELRSTWVKLPPGGDLYADMEIREVLGYSEATGFVDCRHLTRVRRQTRSTRLHSGKEVVPRIVQYSNRPR